MQGQAQLLVVPSGALTALPFHLLVTEKPPAAIPEKFDGYRDAAWLLKRQAVSVLPSVSSLKALRAFARNGSRHKADDRLRRSAVRPGAGGPATASAPRPRPRRAA